MLLETFIEALKIIRTAAYVTRVHSSCSFFVQRCPSQKQILVHQELHERNVSLFCMLKAEDMKKALDPSHCSSTLTQHLGWLATEPSSRVHPQPQTFVKLPLWDFCDSFVLTFLREWDHNAFRFGWHDIDLSMKGHCSMFQFTS